MENQGQNDKVLSSIKLKYLDEATAWIPPPNIAPEHQGSSRDGRYGKNDEKLLDNFGRAKDAR